MVDADMQWPMVAWRLGNGLWDVKVRKNTLCKVARATLQKTLYSPRRRDDEDEGTSRANREIATVAALHSLNDKHDGFLVHELHPIPAADVGLGSFSSFCRCR